MGGLATSHENASPFHEGEQRIQQALGVREAMEQFGRRVVRGFLPDAHAEFYTGLPFMVAAARDARGRPWATVLAGPPGFVSVPDATTLAIGARPHAGDALADAFAEGADVGLLGIELHSRRRNRANGRVGGVAPDGIEIALDQTFGNCPQYIHARRWRSVPVSAGAVAEAPSESLSESQVSWLESADTFFIASGHRGEGEHASNGMDASHRGGPPGFVDVLDDRTLYFPDYTGNDHFNTLGNLLLDPRAGLLFVDFERGGLLQITGRAHIDWDTPDLERFPGARRGVRFSIDEVVEQVQTLPIRWASNQAGAKPLQVIARIEESADVESFVLALPSGEPSAPWKPGQHLPLEVRPEASQPVGRTYSLSNAPGSPFYRISVKREPEGRMSRLLHDGIEVGSTVYALPPAGDFVLDLDAIPEERPIVLVGAGIGITPLVAMLHAIADTAPHRPVLWVQGTRDGAHDPLRSEVRSLIEGLPDARMHVRYSRPREADVEGASHDDTGRVDAALLERLVAERDAEFFLCGPAAFMGEVQAGLERLGVEPARIRFETF